MTSTGGSSSHDAKTETWLPRIGETVELRASPGNGYRGIVVYQCKNAAGEAAFCVQLATPLSSAGGATWYVMVAREMIPSSVDLSKDTMTFLRTRTTARLELDSKQS